MSDLGSLTPLARQYDYVLLDLDGCVYVGDDVVPGAPEAVAALREAGVGVAFVTNDGRHSGEEYVRKLWGLGLKAALEEVVTVGGAIQHVLADTGRWRTAYVVGAPVIHRHVSDAGLKIVNGRDVPPPDVAVLAAHDAFDYDELRGAVQAVLGGAELLCAGRDPIFPMPDGPWPGTGAVVAAVEAATGARAINAGKPAAQPFLTALERLGHVWRPDEAGDADGGDVASAGGAAGVGVVPARPSAAERLAERGRLATERREAAADEAAADEAAAGDDGRPENPFHSLRAPASAPPPAPRDPSAPRALVVGDRLDSDLAGAHAAGLDAAIVLSGATTEREARAATDPAPVAIAATLAELVLGRP